MSAPQTRPRPRHSQPVATVGAAVQTRRRGRRATAGRLRHPTAVSLGLFAAAAVLLAGLFWIGVL